MSGSVVRTLAPYALVGVALPLLVPFGAPPAPTVLNQALALGGCGVLAVALASRVAAGASAAGARPLLWALALLAASALASALFGALPGGLALSSAGALMAALFLAALGAALTSSGRLDEAFGALAAALITAGTVSALLGVVQVYLPEWATGWPIAQPSHAGRAVGNLRQPNHLATLLLWSAISAVWFAEAHAHARERAAAWVLFAASLLGIVLTASRTGVLGVLLLAGWGALDRRLSRGTRIVLIAAPLGYALLWGLGTLSAGADSGFSGAARLREGDLSSSRFAIWANALELLRAHPWRGVGFGEFNLAWTLTDFAQRPGAFFDHTHNLPLQLLVELGLPLGGAVLALLGWALWRAFAAARSGALAQRCALMLLLVAGVHSQLEYPLWYAYFLLPTALAWGLALGASASAGTSRRVAAWQAGGVALLAAGALTAWDYQRVSRVFSPDVDGATSLAQRIDTARDSLLLAHHGDYALATVTREPGRVLDAFARPVHYLLDARLMIAWSRALAQRGDVERARWVAARLREFRHPDGDAFFAMCERPGSAEPPPFQCEPPQRAHAFDEFR